MLPRITRMIMGQQGRDEAGQFARKSNEPRNVRSLRLTDSVWDALGDLADERCITRSDLIEKWVSDGELISENRVEELKLELENLKVNSIYLSEEALSKLDKAAGLRRTTRKEFIEKLIMSDIFDQKIKPVDDSQVSVTKLAKILNADPKTIRDYRDGKRKETLVEWSKNKNIDGKGWDYNSETGMYFQVD